MTNIVISDLENVKLDYTELSDLELESIIGGLWVEKLSDFAWWLFG